MPGNSPRKWSMQARRQDELRRWPKQPPEVSAYPTSGLKTPSSLAGSPSEAAPVPPVAQRPFRRIAASRGGKSAPSGAPRKTRPPATSLARHSRRPAEASRQSLRAVPLVRHSRSSVCHHVGGLTEWGEIQRDDKFSWRSPSNLLCRGSVCNSGRREIRHICPTYIQDEHLHRLLIPV